MKVVQLHISKKQQHFNSHEFFNWIEHTRSLAELMKCAPYFGFWIMSLQDLLRLNEQPIKDAFLYKIARQHRFANMNHNKNFLQEIALSNDQSYSLAWHFNPKFTTTRDATYAIIAEINSLNDEQLRIILLLVLEAASNHIAKHIAKRIADARYNSPLHYLSETHLESEQVYSEMENPFFNIELPPEQRRLAISMTNRIYGALHLMLDGTLRALKTEALLQPDQPRKVMDFA